MGSKYKIGEDDIAKVSKAVADGVKYNTRPSVIEIYDREMDKLFRKHIYCGHCGARYRELTMPNVNNTGRCFHRECPTCGPKSVRLTVSPA